uniref:Uncharacterized protein n=1 Tax=Romanomermis culicivorax TaxID=13658 RepID=A0A915JKY8_ROMCU
MPQLGSFYYGLGIVLVLFERRELSWWLFIVVILCCIPYSILSKVWIVFDNLVVVKVFPFIIR